VSSTPEQGRRPAGQALVAMETERQPSGRWSGGEGEHLEPAGGPRGSNFAAQRSGPERAAARAGSSFKPFTLATFVESGYSIDLDVPGPGRRLVVTSRQCQNLDGLQLGRSPTTSRNEKLRRPSTSTRGDGSVGEHDLRPRLWNRLKARPASAAPRGPGGGLDQPPPPVVLDRGWGTSGVGPPRDGPGLREPSQPAARRPRPHRG